MRSKKGKLQRMVRRKAKKLVAKLRYRQAHDGKKENVFTLRIGPAGLSEKSKARLEKRLEKLKPVKAKKTRSKKVVSQ